MHRREFLKRLTSGLLVATAGPIVAPARKVFRMGVALPHPELFAFALDCRTCELPWLENWSFASGHKVWIEYPNEHWSDLRSEAADGE